jgi:hypothetical protein
MDMVLCRAHAFEDFRTGEVSWPWMRAAARSGLSRICDLSCMQVPLVPDTASLCCLQVFKECCAGETACPTLRAVSRSNFDQMCEMVPNQCSDDGRLLHLSLISEGLDCPFPAALSKLTALTRLDLTFNQLSGRYADQSLPFMGSTSPLKTFSLTGWTAASRPPWAGSLR